MEFIYFCVLCSKIAHSIPMMHNTQSTILCIMSQNAHSKITKHKFVLKHNTQFCVLCRLRNRLVGRTKIGVMSNACLRWSSSETLYTTRRTPVSSASRIIFTCSESLETSASSPFMTGTGFRYRCPSPLPTFTSQSQKRLTRGDQSRPLPI